MGASNILELNKMAPRGLLALLLLGVALQWGAAATVSEVSPGDAALEDVRGMWCEGCKMMVKRAEELIDGKHLNGIVDFFIDHLPVSTEIKKAVKSVIQPYIDVIAEFVKKHAVKPVKVCQKLRICPRKGLLELIDGLEEFADQESVSAPSPCKMCKLIVTMYEQFINYPMIKAQIDSGLHQACTHLPISDKGVKMCGDAVTNLLKLAYTFIARPTSAVEFCQFFTMCPAQF